MQITLYLPGDAFLPDPVSQPSAVQAFTHALEETGSGLHHVVTSSSSPNTLIWRSKRSVNPSVFLGRRRQLEDNGCPAWSPYGIGVTVAGKASHVPIGRPIAGTRPQMFALDWAAGRPSVRPPASFCARSALCRIRLSPSRLCIRRRRCWRS